MAISKGIAVSIKHRPDHHRETAIEAPPGIYDPIHSDPRTGHQLSHGDGIGGQLAIEGRGWGDCQFWKKKKIYMHCYFSMHGKVLDTINRAIWKKKMKRFLDFTNSQRNKERLQKIKILSKQRQIILFQINIKIEMTAMQ